MKIIMWCLCTAYLTGCIPAQQTSESDAPQLLFQTSLPAIPVSIEKLPSEISLALFILENGTVEKVRFSKSSGSVEWDSLAALAIKQWRFAPARMNGKPFSTWFHFRAPLHYANPRLVSLAEIVCATEETADSIFEALEQGQDFSELATRYSLDSSRENHGIIGEVNAYCYPENIRSTLTRLEVEQYTQPILYGDHYIVFKRIKK